MYFKITILFLHIEHLLYYAIINKEMRCFFERINYIFCYYLFICLFVAAIYSYISNNNLIISIFSVFDFIILLGVYVISKITKNPTEDYTTYQSIHSI